jgi:signal transduction histidine kinase
MRSPLARLRALDPYRADAILAAVFGVEALVEVAVLVPGRTPDDAIAIALVLLLAGAVAVRRRWPLAATVAAWIVFASVQYIPRPWSSTLVLPFFVVLFLAYSSGRHLDGRRAVAAFVFGSLLNVVAVAHESDRSVANALTTVALAVAAPMLIGRFMRHRAQLHTTLHEKTERLALARREAAEEAAADERTRIAGELHDVVAHALSAMVVQGSAARRLAPRDPDRAATAFAAVESTGREALAEIRSLLGVLRREDEELALAPHPSLRHLGSLVSRARAAGLPVDLSVEGDAQPLTAGVDLTAYRVVQEALRSALEQGEAGHAEVLLRYGSDHVDVRIVDDGRVAPDRQLPGVRERVTLYGGQLRAGARRDGGHGVRARLPLGGAA